MIFLLYASTLAQGFHFDDYHMVTENQFIKSWGSLSRMAITPFISSASTVKGMYRPVLMATFCWNYQTGALNPFGFHLVNVWLHLIVVCLVVGLSRRLWPSLRPLWILLAASVWAVHPIHTEAVAYISSRSSILAALFVVLAHWLYAAARQSPGRRRWGLFIGSLLAYGLALGSKEIAVTLPGLLFLVEWKLTQCQAPWCQAPRCLAPFRRLAPFFLLTALYLVWRKLLIGAVGVVYPVRPWRENTLMQLEGISSYLKLWLWPVNQTVVHPQPAGHGAGPWLGLGMLVGLGILAWGVRRRWPGLTFALGWAGVTFLPPAFASSLNLVVAEHHLYLPSVGFALGLPQMLEALSSPRRACPRPDRGRGSSLTLIALALTLVLSVATFRRNLVWADDFTLWVDAARKNPMSCMVHNNLGLEYEKRGELEDALR
ncbi:MAG: hypothetical protein HYZ93_07030, partial [Candidatus Omnitrophica bacterium]|nr:hypothetical protein [Candidatus Omnitrophota bacterium]